MKRLLHFLIFVGILITVVPAAEAEITSMAEAINKAGRQRMLSQRMLKAYCMIGVNVDKEKARKQLNGAIALFDSQLSELEAFAPNESIEQSLNKVKKLWKPYKVKLQNPVERASAEELMEASDEILRASHKVVLQLEDISDSQLGRMVNIAGRQRMLTQRLAKLYMLRSWNFESAEIRSEIEQSKNEFKGALTELISTKENSPRLIQELSKAEKEWTLLEHGLERTGDELVPLIVSVTSETLLERMNGITSLYEQLFVAGK